MPSRATAPPRVRPGRAAGPTRLVAVVAAVALGLLALWPIARVLALPATVGSLTVENPGTVPLHVAVAAPGDDDVLGLGTVDPRTELTFDDVLDQGSDWVVIVRRAGGGASVTTVEVPRAELSAGDWRIVLPADPPGGRPAP